MGKSQVGDGKSIDGKENGQSLHYKQNPGKVVNTIPLLSLSNELV